jgi:hypothetical protein
MKLSESGSMVIVNGENRRQTSSSGKLKTSNLKQTIDGMACRQLPLTEGY